MEVGKKRRPRVHTTETHLQMHDAQTAQEDSQK